MQRRVAVRWLPRLCVPPKHSFACHGACVTASRGFSTRDQQMHREKRPPFYVPCAEDAQALRGSNDSPITDSALEGQLAYRHYAAQLGLCSYEDLQAGVRQAHDSLANVIERLTASETEPSKEMVTSYQKLLQSGMKRSEIAAVLQTWHAETTLAEGRKILSESFRPESEWNLTAVASPAATEASSKGGEGAAKDAQTARRLITSLLSSSSKEEKAQKVRSAFQGVRHEADIFVAGLTSILPISRDMANDVLMLWAGYRLGLANVLVVAGPNDFVGDVDVAGLVDLYNGKVYGEDTLRREFELEVRLTDALREKVGSQTSSSAATPAVSAADDDDAATKASAAEGPTKAKVFFNATKRAAAKQAPKAPAPAAASTAVKAESAPRDDVAVRFLVPGIHGIPLDARLALFASVKVHVPKERYPKVFTPRTAHERLGDWLNRAGHFFLGHRPAFLDNVFGRILFGVVPQRLDGYTTGPGVMEKLMILYMEPSGRWVVSDLLPIRAVPSTAKIDGLPDMTHAPRGPLFIMKGVAFFAVVLLISSIPTVLFFLSLYGTYVLVRYCVQQILQ